MKAIDAWRPSKYVTVRGGSLKASPDPEEVNIRSRMIVDLAGAAYAKAVRSHVRGKVADVGCGKVPLYDVYRNLASEVICIDWPGSLHVSPHLDIEADLTRGIPLEDASVDTIIATDVIEHLADPAVIWRDFHRVLSRGGKLILGVPFMYFIHEEPHDHFRYTRFRLERYCQEAGLTLLELEEYGGPIAVMLDLVGKNLPTRPAGVLFQSFARSLIRIPAVRKLDRMRAARFPLGYCLVARKD
jgi:SAM-dependent methyltransferase